MRPRISRPIHIVFAVFMVVGQITGHSTAAEEEEQSAPSTASEALAANMVESTSRYTFPVLAPLIPVPMPVADPRLGMTPTPPTYAGLPETPVGIGVEELLPVPVDPGNLLMSDYDENPTLSFGFGIPFGGQSGTAERMEAMPAGGIPTTGPVVLLRTGVTANVDVLYDTGFQTGLSPAGLATSGSEDRRRAGQFNLQGSSAEFTWDAQTTGTAVPIQGYFEGDFGSDGLGSRQVFGRIANLLGGKNWTSFADADLLPRTIIKNKAAAGSVYRPGVAQLQYMYPFRRDAAVGISIEQSIDDDFELNDPDEPNSDNVRLHRYPDLVTRLRYVHPDLWGMSQTAVILRTSGYEDLTCREHFVTGWGVSGNTRLRTFGYDNIRMGIVGGRGIGSYLYGMETVQSAVFSNGQLRPLSCLGAYLGYQHIWTPHLWSSVTCGHAQTEGVADRFVDAPKCVYNGWIDLVWNVNENCSAGFEYTYATKEAWGGHTGDSHQILFSLQIGTASAPSKASGSTAQASTSPSIMAAPRGGVGAAPPVRSSRSGYSMRM